MGAPMSRCAVLSIVIVLACARTRPAAEPPPPTACAGAPLTARWTRERKRPAGAGTRLTLEGVVEVPGVVPGAVTVTLAAPEGSVGVGPLARDLGVLPQGAAVPVTFEIDYPATPAKDAVLEVDARDGDAFAHVTLAYRFGRPAAPSEVPAATGPRAVLRGIDLGPSIPLPAR